jgi:iron only hydrogenase large subunit-like protein/nitrogen-specific signal transduction histidine kinase
VSSSFITTISERCRMCYTCVRECPVKAICITEGQAKVIGDRCIACGNCLRICSQHAKLLRSSVDEVLTLLSSGECVAACIAPSFPAEFSDILYTRLVGMIRELGFHLVVEVSFGADLVAREYARFIAQDDGHRYISTTCPAIVGYVEKYYPDLVDSLAPIVSPMIAMSRALRRLHGDNLKIVFIGPCVAKKVEALDPAVEGEIDGVLMFSELRQMCNEAGLDPEQAQPSDFDAPHGGMGGLFPVSRGILQAANLREDLLTGEVVATQGRSHILEAIREFASGDLGARLLEVLCCEGCITGPGVNSDMTLFNRRRQVRTHVCHRMECLDRGEWSNYMERLSDIDLNRVYRPNDQRIATPAKRDLEAIMHRMGKYLPGDELNCGACGYDTCVEHAIAIYKNLAESEMCLPNTIDQLRSAIKEVEASHGQLAAAQEALVQSEKLASMGQLAAGIAHEVNNPLGVVLMYSHLLLEECDNQSKMREDLSMIAEQADRCKKIVAGLLHFARQNKVCCEPHDLCKLIDHAIRAINVPENITIRLEYEMIDPMVELDRDQIIQVLTNLVSNAIAAMGDGGTITIRTNDDGQRVRFAVEDSGTGIPPDNLKKIFDPFFTTKQMGMGTGLGLAVTYGIVKMHSGDIRVESQSDPSQGPTGTTFTVSLPRTEKTGAIGA